MLNVELIGKGGYGNTEGWYGYGIGYGEVKDWAGWPGWDFPGTGNGMRKTGEGYWMRGGLVFFFWELTGFFFTRNLDARHFVRGVR